SVPTSYLPDICGEMSMRHHSEHRCGIHVTLYVFAVPAEKCAFDLAIECAVILILRSVPTGCLFNICGEMSMRHHSEHRCGIHVTLYVFAVPAEKCAFDLAIECALILILRSVPTGCLFSICGEVSMRHHSEHRCGIHVTLY